MAKSRKNQGREAQLAKYKESKKQSKKSMEVPKFKPFRQVPHWEPDAEIKITGAEFSLLQNFLNVFAEPINVMQDIFSRSLNDGTVSIKYVDNEGKEVSKDEVQEYMKEVQTYLAAQAQETSTEAVATLVPEGTSELAETEPTTSTVDTTSASKRKLKVVTD